MTNDATLSLMKTGDDVQPEVRQALLPTLARGMSEARRIFTTENDLVPPLMLLKAGDGTWMTVRSGWTGPPQNRKGFKEATQMLVCGIDAASIVVTTTGWAASFEADDARAKDLLARYDRGEGVSISSLPEDLRHEVFVLYAADRQARGWFRICRVVRDENQKFLRLVRSAEHGATTREGMFPAVESWMCELMPRPGTVFSARERLGAMAAFSESVLRRRQPFFITSWPSADATGGDDEPAAFRRLMDLAASLTDAAAKEVAATSNRTPEDDSLAEELARALGGRKQTDDLVN